MLCAQVSHLPEFNTRLLRLVQGGKLPAAVDTASPAAPPAVSTAPPETGSEERKATYVAPAANNVQQQQHHSGPLGAPPTTAYPTPNAPLEPPAANTHHVGNNDASRGPRTFAEAHATGANLPNASLPPPSMPQHGPMRSGIARHDPAANSRQQNPMAAASGAPRRHSPQQPNGSIDRRSSLQSSRSSTSRGALPETSRKVGGYLECSRAVRGGFRGTYA